MPDNAGSLCLSRVIAMADLPRLSRRTLFIFLLASIALHALLLLWLPGWRLSVPAQDAAPVLDVVMVLPERAAAAAVAAPPTSPPPQPQPRRTVAPPAVKPQAAPSPPALPAPVAASAAAVEDAPPPPVSPSAPVAAAQPAAPAAASPATVTPPVFTASYLRNPPPAYPALARRSGEEGTVMLRVLVGRDGAPLKVEVDQSSRSRLLDHAAQDAVKGWRFVPARRGAETIEAWVRVPVSFRLES